MVGDGDEIVAGGTIITGHLKRFTLAIGTAGVQVGIALIRTQSRQIRGDSIEVIGPGDLFAYAEFHAIALFLCKVQIGTPQTISAGGQCHPGIAIAVVGPVIGIVGNAVNLHRSQSHFRRHYVPLQAEIKSMSAVGRHHLGVHLGHAKAHTIPPLVRNLINLQLSQINPQCGTDSVCSVINIVFISADRAIATNNGGNRLISTGRS